MNLGSVLVRPVLPDEIETVAALRAIGFGGDKQGALKSLVNNPRHDTPNLLGAEYEGDLIGTGAVFPAQMWLSGVPLDIGAVAGITVLPEYREQGVAAKIMEFLIIRMYAEQRALSLLFPFSHKYYRTFGYGTVSDLHAYRFRPDNIIDFEGADKVRPYSPDDLHLVRVLYKGELTWHNGWFTRSNEWWDKILNQWSNIVVYDDDMVAGYLAYNLSTNEMGERVLKINELFAPEDEAYRGLLAYLAGHDDVDMIDYLAPAQTPLRHSLRQPIAVNARNHGWIFNDLCYITAGPMARIINLPKALTTRFYTRGMSGEKVLKVTDPLIPSNEDPLVFRLVDGRAETHPASDRKPQVETDISTLTQILCGYLKASDARRLGWFKADEDTCSWLDKIIVDTPLYIQAGDWF
jgi:predicted acetyltransferase